jgi:cell division protein FtsQ
VEKKVVSIEDRIPKLKEQRKKKANRRIIILLTLFFLLVISIVYFQSPLSKIREIHVTGNSYIPTNDIIEASNLTDKTVVFNLKKDDIKKRILTLPEVKNVDVSIKFPNDVSIQIEEYRQLGYIMQEGTLKPLLETGSVNHYLNGAMNPIGPVITNFGDKDILNVLVKQLKVMDEEIRNSISQIIYSPKDTDKFGIIAFMNDGFEVRGTLRTFAEKMSYYPAVVKQLPPDNKGIIDLEVGLFFKSYQSELNREADEEESEEDSEN